MKQYLFFLLSVLFLFSCGNHAQKNEKVEPENVANKQFGELFKSILPEKMTDNVFKLVGKDVTVITAGNESHFNSMAASWGGVGIIFNKPVTWCFLRSGRYTLELIRNGETYTMSYFSDAYKDQVLFFGSKSGRNTDKMKETTLTAIQTPSGNITYKEARLVLECKLTELTTVSPEDFYTQEGKDFITGAYDETGDYHKLVFGEITNIWVKKK